MLHGDDVGMHTQTCACVQGGGGGGAAVDWFTDERDPPLQGSGLSSAAPSDAQQIATLTSSVLSVHETCQRLAAGLDKVNALVHDLQDANRKLQRRKRKRLQLSGSESSDKSSSSDSDG